MYFEVISAVALLHQLIQIFQLKILFPLPELIPKSTWKNQTLFPTKFLSKILSKRYLLGPHPCPPKALLCKLFRFQGRVSEQWKKKSTNPK